MDKDAYAYINTVTDERRALYDSLERVILELCPQPQIKRSYGIVMYHSGKGKVWLGYRKDGVSLYTGGPETISEFQREYPQFKTGRGCIKFKPGEEIPWERVKELVGRFLLN